MLTYWLLRLIPGMLGGLTVWGAIDFYRAVRRNRKNEIRVGDSVQLTGVDFEIAHEMVGEVTRIEPERLGVWVVWENDAQSNYEPAELKKVDAATPGIWLGDCGEPTCAGRHYVLGVERHGGKRTVKFMCGQHAIRQSERRFLAAFERLD
jgi:hypothetical protein